ncbi:hypothetical protein IVB69_05675 [Flavobacterium sp. J49]|uniref:hypothetical protein n=1 Tax=Flavobacterium sp. J49 TaxID=2718534 RepID=UPI001592F951|nr:hypothetical protein [Flavobacterium sp. J49]MBF6640961.1 hypothetical protein [Flavobacterium sp. J49]NIC02208.1 hypothetical protein [Flavobacterium sp. J49]
MRNIIILFAILLLGCNKPKEKAFEYYVISKQYAEMQRIEKEGKALFPVIPQGMKWYSNLVFIMDSSNVYIYQTTENQSLASQKIKEYNFPNFIGLKPEHIIAIPGKDLLPFLKVNNDLFELVNKPKNRHTAFYIASTLDTIKNQAYYDLCKYLQKEEHIFYKARKVTEEEANVIKYKVSHKNYVAEKIKWSKNFILGNSSPFTKEYIEEEKNAQGVRKSIETFKRNSNEIMYFE